MKQKFRSLPAAVQVAVTAVVVVVLAVVLTVWRHNGSTYLTGFWDNGSQTLVFGRMLQMQQNQTSPGGFMGVYTPIKPPGLVWFCCICSMRPNTRVWEPLSQKPVR